MHTQRNVSPKQETVIRVSTRSGVWTVTVNGRFYGDYVRRDWALEAAAEKQRAIVKKGDRALVHGANSQTQETFLRRAGRLLGIRGSHRVTGEPQ
jgi:hypothetical protein